MSVRPWGCPVLALALVLALAASVLIGCGESDVVVAVPTTPTSESAVVIVERRATDVWANDLRAGAPGVPIALTAESARVTAFLYDHPLADLGLAPGQVQVVAPEQPGEPIEDPADSYELQVTDGTAGAWRSLDPTPEDRRLLVRFPRAVAPECLFSLTAYDLPGTGDGARFLVVPSEAEAEALVSTSQTLFAFDGVTAPRLISDVPEGLPMLSATTDRAGQIWFAGVGAVWLGRFDGVRVEASRVAVASTRAPIFEIAHDGRDLYALDTLGRFFRLGATGEEILYQFAQSPENREGAIVVLAPGELVAVNGDSDVVVRVRGSTISIDRPRGVSGFGISAGANIPGLGVVLATTGGTVLLEDGATWKQRTIDNFLQRVRAIAPWGDGYVIAGGSGVLTRFVRRVDGFCPISGTVNPSRHATPFRGGVLLAGSAVASEVLLTWLRP
ncbi:MAG: hypothetical protein IT384_20840 [Deltaproteobacteria bacterium]|nr:hypothetical protein [Deltaproteobacteria bacterium]